MKYMMLTSASLACFAACGLAYASQHGDAHVFSAAANAATQQGDDPLFRYQWHLLNQGQPVFGDGRPLPGVDLDVDILHALGIRGAGVKVAAIDDGLRSHTRPGRQYRRQRLAQFPDRLQRPDATSQRDR